MYTFRFNLALFILFFAGLVALSNWLCAVGIGINKWRGIDRHISMVPLISFLFTVVAYGVYPSPGKAIWMTWIPLLDIGNWVMVAAVPVLLFRDWRRK